MRQQVFRVSVGDWDHYFLLFWWYLKCFEAHLEKEEIVLQPSEIPNKELPK